MNQKKITPNLYINGNSNITFTGELVRSKDLNTKIEFKEIEQGEFNIDLQVRNITDPMQGKKVLETLKAVLMDEKGFSRTFSKVRIGRNVDDKLTIILDD